VWKEVHDFECMAVEAPVRQSVACCSNPTRSEARKIVLQEESEDRRLSIASNPQVGWARTADLEASYQRKVQASRERSRMNGSL
jgi:hypothetical protein